MKKLKRALINKVQHGDRKLIKKQTGFCYASINKALNGKPVSRHILAGVELAILNIEK